MSCSFKPKAIAVDLDGTLLDTNKQVSKANREALIRCLEKGVMVVPATSRPLRSSRIILKDSAICPGPGVFLGGAFAVGPDGFVCVDRRLPQNKMAEALSIVEQHSPGAWITVETADDKWFSNRDISETSLAEIPSELMKSYGYPEIVGLDGLMKQKANKIIVSWDGKSLGESYKRLLERFSKSLSYVLTVNEEWLEILPENTGKETALEVLLSRCGISIKDCAAFGDGSNDVTFLKGCGYSIAMANAVPKCLEIADYVTKTNDEDGFAWAVQELFGI